jgi:hypothetical protein
MLGTWLVLVSLWRRCEPLARTNPAFDVDSLGIQLRRALLVPIKRCPMAVVRKLKKILQERFLPPYKVNLRDEDGIIGVVTRSDSVVWIPCNARTSSTTYWRLI